MEEKQESKSAHDLPPVLRISSGGMDCYVCDATSIDDAIKIAINKCKPAVLGLLMKIDSGEKVVLLDTLATLQKIGEEGWQRIKIK